MLTRGPIKSPHLVLIYGPDGVGKSTFGAQAPRPVFLGPEQGTENLDVVRLPKPKNWADVNNYVDWLWTAEAKKENFGSLCIDSLDWLEPLLFDEVIRLDSEMSGKVRSMAAAHGGYNKAYDVAFNMNIDFRDKLTRARHELGLNIILICHSQKVEFVDPVTEHNYNRYELKLQENKSVSMRAMWREYVDSVLFANEVVISKGEGKAARGISTGQNKIWTRRNAAYDAKSRFAIPEEIDLNFEAYAQAVDQARLKGESADEVYKEAMALTAHEKIDDKLAQTMKNELAKAKNDVAMLKTLKTRIQQIRGEV